MAAHDAKFSNAPLPSCKHSRRYLFFTVVTYRRREFLCDADVRGALREAITKVRVQHPFCIDAWVLSPDHLYAIWTLPPTDAGFVLPWQQIKRYVTRRCGTRLHRAAWMT
jgi:putative transposase